ncbi:MAG: ATP-binding protein [Bacteroidota bacterium]
MESDIRDQFKSQSIFQENVTSFMEKLAKVQLDFGSLSENISQGLARCEIICDENDRPIDGKFLSANKAFEKHTGLKREICLGRTIKEVFPGVEQSWIDTYGRVAQNQKSEIITGYNHGTKRYYRSLAYSDRPGEFIMLFEDTTHQISLEKAYNLVSKSTKQTEDLLENLQEGFMYCKVIRNGNNRAIDSKVLSVNSAYEKQTGVKKDAIVGKNMLDVFPEMDRRKLEGLCKVGLTGESTTFIDSDNFTGRTFDISAFSPRPMEFILIIRDITEREKARVDLENAYKKVEESEKLKSAFLANMSHEIRTPLNAILGFSELLEENNLSEIEKQKCLDNIKSAGHRLSSIISDILDISKLEANRQKLHFAVHNLNRILDRLQEQFRVINENDLLKLTTEKQLSFEEAYIETDAVRLEQILSNLIENALKHTEEGKVTFGYVLKGMILEFFVRDTGPGIRKKDQATIFKRFRQVNNKTKINKGTGLGIPIAAGLTQLFGGKMWLDSEAGLGSTFYFTIPFLPRSTTTNLNKKPTILVAEDEETNFLLLEMWLKKYCHLIHANNGHETVSILEEEKKDIDLVLMDIRMPYLSGIEATKEIRKLNEKIPIIAQTAFIMDDEKEEILNAGCNAMVSKPIQREEFKKLLTSYIPDLKFA